MWLSGQGTCLGYLKPWVPSAALGKLGSTGNSTGLGVTLPAGDFPWRSGLLSSVHYASLLDCVYIAKTNLQALPMLSATPDRLVGPINLDYQLLGMS